MSESTTNKEGEILYAEADPEKINNFTILGLIPKCPEAECSVEGLGSSGKMIIKVMPKPECIGQIEKIRQKLEAAGLDFSNNKKIAENYRIVERQNEQSLEERRGEIRYENHISK